VKGIPKPPIEKNSFYSTTQWVGKLYPHHDIVPFVFLVLIKVSLQGVKRRACALKRFGAQAWQSDQKGRCEGEARGNLKSSLALLGTRLHGVYPEQNNEILRGACPEPKKEILRFAQNDTWRRAQNDKK
jgi:hypothetical protein